MKVLPLRLINRAFSSKFNLKLALKNSDGGAMLAVAHSAHGANDLIFLPALLSATPNESLATSICIMPCAVHNTKMVLPFCGAAAFAIIGAATCSNNEKSAANAVKR